MASCKVSDLVEGKGPLVGKLLGRCILILGPAIAARTSMMFQSLMAEGGEHGNALLEVMGCKT